MTSSRSTSSSFRFRDLPIEIRNKIYRNLLCDFAPPPTTVDPMHMLRIQHAHHSSGPAILRVNAETYREAYDVMVKTNLFIKVTADYGVPLLPMLCGLGVPAVADDETIIEQYSGYVVSVHLRKRYPVQAPGGWEKSTLVILYRDLDAFCRALTDGDVYVKGFSKKVHISIKVGPVLDDVSLKKYRKPLDGFFSEKTQETLLAPFKKRLRGFELVEIHGHVSRMLADTVSKDIRQEGWSHPGNILAEFVAAKEEGSQLFCDGKQSDACLRWQDAAVDIDKIHESTSWTILVQRGGEQFVSKVAEIYFILQLNIAHIQLIDMEKHRSKVYIAEVFASNALDCAISSIEKGFWMSDFMYAPPIKLSAKLCYRYALLCRLRDNPQDASRALTYIDKALQGQPNDATILRERQNILAWMKQY